MIDGRRIYGLHCTLLEDRPVTTRSGKLPPLFSHTTLCEHRPSMLHAVSNPLSLLIAAVFAVF
ncbi:hypothetical protein LK487_18760, partial [[Eubacterium] rectale]|nr:hypothetical protein [Agathobacter rectalis]